MSWSRRFALALVGTLAMTNVAGAQDLRELPEELRDVGFDQRLGESLALDALFRDEAGVERPLGDYMTGRPAILALVYYDCPMLCTLVLNGLVRSLRPLELTVGEEFDVLVVSFDPREGPELATAKRSVYLESYGRSDHERGWHFLTGEETQIRRLTDSVGFRYAFDEETGEFAHAAGIVLTTPDGRIARYLYGIDYPPRDLRLGLVEASEGSVGTLVDQALLFCFHYDPLSGQYTLAAMTAVRIGGLATLLVLVVFIVRALRRERRSAGATA